MDIKKKVYAVRVEDAASENELCRSYTVSEVWLPANTVAVCKDEQEAAAVIEKYKAEDKRALTANFSEEEYPSKLVIFRESEEIKLFRRRPGNTQSKSCVYISQDVVNAFKNAATNKTNYSISKAVNAKLYLKWEAYINKLIVEREI